MSDPVKPLKRGNPNPRAVERTAESKADAGEINAKDATVEGKRPELPQGIGAAFSPTGQIQHQHHQDHQDQAGSPATASEFVEALDPAVRLRLEHHVDRVDPVEHIAPIREAGLADQDSGGGHIVQVPMEQLRHAPLPGAGSSGDEPEGEKREGSAEMRVGAPAPAEPCQVTWEQAEGRLESATGLERLPAGLDFPADFPEPIRYDTAKKQLAYRGFMSAASFRYLQGLNSDPAYLHAIERLSGLSVRAIVSHSKPKRAWIWATLAACLCAATAGALLWLRSHPS